MIPWFRFYSEVLDDPKVLLIKSSTIRWRWVLILCLANKGTPRGVLPPVAAIAMALRISRPDAESLIRILSERELLEHDGQRRLRPHGWAERQFESDDAAVRMRRLRADRSEQVRPQITDTDSDPERDRRLTTGPSPKPGQKTSPLTVVSPPRNTVIADLVDLFRAIPNVVPSPNDGGTIASLVGRYGANRVRRVIQDKTPAISAADSPRLFLASCFEKRGKQTTVGMTMDEKAKHYQSFLTEDPKRDG
jgi:hypothetical protein